MPTGRDRPSFLSLFCLLFLFFSRRVHAGGVQFTHPPGGGAWPAGPITVAWIGAGGVPAINELLSYTLQLVVGGTTTENSGVIATLDKGAVSSNQTQIIIASNVSHSIQNGFYLMMTSTVNNGDKVINYSNRFTLIGLDGTTLPAYVAGAQAAAGMADVPGSQYIWYNGSSSTATSSPTAHRGTSPTSSSTSTTPPGPNSSGSSPFGLILGLSIGLVFAIALIAIIGIAALVRRRRKRRHARSTDDALNDRAYLGDKAELPGLSASPTDSVPVEMSAYRRSVPGLHEMPEQDAAVEAGDRDSIRFELEGDWTGWEAGSGRKSQAYDPTR